MRSPLVRWLPAAIAVLAQLLAAQAPAWADGPRSAVLVAGTGKEHPRPGDHVVIYRSEVDASGRPRSQIAYLPLVTLVDVGTSEGSGLAQMVVGEKRRFWITRADGRTQDIVDIELLSIAGPNPPDEERLILDGRWPTPRDASYTPTGLAYVVARPGTGTAHPEPADRVHVIIWGSDPPNHALVDTIPAGSVILADIPIPTVVEALRAMVAGEERYYWIPPERNAGRPMFIHLVLAHVEKRRQLPPPANLAAPPKSARPLRGGGSFVTLRRGRTERPLAPEDEVTYEYTAWRPDGLTLVSETVRDRPLGSLPVPLREALGSMGVSERRRLWLTSLPRELDYLSPGRATSVVIDVRLVSIQRKIDALPGGMRIVAWLPGRRSFTIGRGGVTAPLPLEAGRISPVTDRVEPTDIVAVKLSPDRATVAVSLVDNCLAGDFVVTYPVAALQARLENASALRIHRARKYPEAERAFRRVVGLDPDFELGYTNLASALALQGKAREAVDALRPLIDRNPAWVYHKVLEDSELATLAEAPEIVALRAPTRGTARVDLLAATAAWSAEHDLIAAVMTGFDSALLILAPDGAVRARIRLVSGDEIDVDCYESPERCDPVLAHARPAVAARKARADALLRDLGFSPVPGSDGRVIAPQQGRPPRVSFDAAKLGLVLGKDKVRVVRHDDVLVEADAHGAELIWAVLFPGMIVYRWLAPGSEMCGSDPSGIATIRSPALP